MGRCPPNNRVGWRVLLASRASAEGRGPPRSAREAPWCTRCCTPPSSGCRRASPRRARGSRPWRAQAPVVRGGGGGGRRGGRDSAASRPRGGRGATSTGLSRPSFPTARTVAVRRPVSLSRPASPTSAPGNRKWPRASPLVGGLRRSGLGPRSSRAGAWGAVLKRVGGRVRPAGAPAGSLQMKRSLPSSIPVSGLGGSEIRTSQVPEAITKQKSARSCADAGAAHGCGADCARASVWGGEARLWGSASA